MAAKASRPKPKIQRNEGYTCSIALPESGSARYGTVLHGGKYKRSVISITRTAAGTTIEIRALDATALRASVNSVLRDLQVAEASSKI